MLTTSTFTFVILLLSFFVTAVLTFVIYKKIDKSQLRTVFILTLSCLSICFIGLIFQVLFSNRFGIPPIYFDYFVYIGTCLLPVGIFFTGIIFAKTKIEFKKSYFALFIVPIISLLILWTNDYHHLFYEKYSVNFPETIYGPYMTIHSIYSYGLLLVGLFYLMSYSIKNAGFFSRQSILLIIGILISLITNILGTFGILHMTVYMTPITFAIGILFWAIAIFKFNFLSITPIALQKIVDKISDGYIVIDENNKIIDFNKTFLMMSGFKDSYVRNKNLYTLIKDNSAISIDIDTLKEILSSVKKTTKTLALDKYFESLNMHFHIEFSRLNNKNSFIGTLILFKNITQHVEDMKTIKNNQETLMENERLASLGQLIGGIAHNLKTPIMSISGAAEGLSDLIKEYDSSIDDPEVNSQDHHDIALDMSTWVSKIKTHTEYMSDVITAVKGQAVNLSNENDISFTVTELVKRVNILMRHELKNSIVYLKVLMKTDENTIINGDVNSLVQVINNMISNSIQAYDGKPEQNIDLIVDRDDNNLLISVRDYGCGLPDKVKDKLFKEMITTKGKNGTGLGLYMSYSTIRAHFNGNITVESEIGNGTTFTITLPI